MSTTAKTVLIVAGAGVGVFILLKVLSPSPATLPKQSNSSSAGTLQGLIGLAGGIKNLFSSSSSSSSGSINPAYSDAASQATLRDFDSSNYTVNEGFMFTDTSGHFIAG